MAMTMKTKSESRHRGTFALVDNVAPNFTAIAEISRIGASKR